MKLVIIVDIEEHTDPRIADITDGGDHILFQLHDNLSLVLSLRTEVSKISNQSASAQRSAEFILSHVAYYKKYFF